MRAHRSHPASAEPQDTLTGAQLILHLAQDVHADRHDADGLWIPDTPETRSMMFRAACVPSQIDGSSSPDVVARLRQLVVSRWMPNASRADRDAVLAVPYFNDFRGTAQDYTDRRAALVAQPWLALAQTTPYRDELSAVCLSLIVGDGRSPDVDMDMRVGNAIVIHEPWDAQHAAYPYRVAVARHLLAAMSNADPGPQQHT